MMNTDLSVTYNDIAEIPEKKLLFLRSESARAELHPACLATMSTPKFDEATQVRRERVERFCD